MSIHSLTDFTDTVLAEKYSSSLFSLITYLSIRVGMTVKQRLQTSNIGSSMHPQELKLFKHILYQIKNMKTFEQDKNKETVMFSKATSKLYDQLVQLFQ